MDYEKLHKDTINKLQQMVNSGKITVETACGICADFVPESEDEKIRKEILEYFNQFENGELRGVDITPWLAWLEKQGKQKPINNQFTPEQANILDKHIDKFLEQKPAWSEEDEKIYQSIMDDTVQENQLNDKQTDWLRDIKYRYFPQPKQEWSEDDETVVNSIISFCDFKVNIEQHNEGVKEVSKKVLSWLNELKGRVQPQSKQGWSEEAQQIIKDAACFILSCVNTAETKEEEERLEELADKLQDLRPQKKEALPQWRRLPLNGVSCAPDYWCVMDVITSTVGANSASVSALVKGDYYVPLFELEKFIRNI